jgi:hypothetical protein
MLETVFFFMRIYYLLLSNIIGLVDYCIYIIEIRLLIEKGPLISRRPSHGQFERWCCPQAFLRIFSEVTYSIRTVGNSTLLKIYTLPNLTITIGVCILETQLSGLLYGCGASYVLKWAMPWMSANII